MQPNAVMWLAAAFITGFFVIGVPYWQMPYAKVSLPSALYGPGLLAIGGLAAAARALGQTRLFTVILAVGAAVPAPILARIIVETEHDQTSHNLWPFEVIIGVVIGVLCSSMGALIGSVIARLSHKTNGA
jgi:hypothetical protein